MSNDATGIDVHLKASVSPSELVKIDPAISLADTAARLKLIRDAFGFSQRELAKRAGVTNSSISMIEQGQVSPSIQSLVRILAAFPISLSDFFSFNSKPSVLVSDSDNSVTAPVYDSTNLGTQTLGVINAPPQLNARIEHLLAGQATAFSAPVVDSCGIVVDGSAQLTLLSGKQLLVRGSNFYIPAGQPFRLMNVTDERVSFFVCSLFVHKG